MKRFLCIASLALGALAAPRAHADSGVVQGLLGFWNKNGNYCPTSTDCGGSLYPQSAYDKNTPLSNIQVFVENDAVGTLGSGTSDINGWFTVNWSISGSVPDPTHSYVWLRYFEKDWRFFIQLPNGSYPWAFTSYMTLQNGTTSTNTQKVGTWSFGTSAAPDPYMNTFWAAERAWRFGLSGLGLFAGNYTGVEIRAFADSTPVGYMPAGGESCPTSCSWGAQKRIALDANAALMPQSRVMHEMGHVAAQVAKAHHSVNVACNGTAGWQYQSSECGPVILQESLADFAASTTLYSQDEVDPRTCSSTGSCGGLSGYSLEASGICGGTTQRQPIQGMTFLWDLFDTHNDGESVAGTRWNVWWAFAGYAAGAGAGQVDEPWNSSFTALDDQDKRGMTSFRDRYNTSSGFNSTPAHTLNCSPL